MKFSLDYPTSLHRAAAEAACAFFRKQPGVDTVLVVNSLARGQGLPESDLDMNVLVSPELPAEEVARMELAWQTHLHASEPLRQFQASGEHAHVHLDVIKGDFLPGIWDDGGGPDGFELGIGNLLAYGAPMGEPGPYFLQLKKQWLPYYGEDLRRQRLQMARGACRYDLGHVPFFTGRGLYFQAFDRLYKGFQEFLQALFIARRAYPLAYNKWIRMQVVEWLGLPDLYAELPGILSVSNFESDETVNKADRLNRLLERWTADA